MPRYNNNNSHQIHQEKKNNSGHCRIRKRVSSSSSSSSIVKNYRFKRLLLVGKKVGSSTPVPTWKVVMAAGSRSPLQKFQSFEDGVKYGGNGVISSHYKGKEALSARKLAANLWEINGLHSPVRKDDFFDERRPKKSSDKLPHSLVCEKNDGSKVGSHRRRSSTTSQKLQITEYMAGGIETIGRASSIEGGNHVAGEGNRNINSRLKDVNNSLVASKEIVKVLYRIVSQEEQQSSKLTLVSALRMELDRARLQVDQLIQEQRYHCDQMDALFKQFAEEKASWRSKEKQKIKEAISSLSREVVTERKLRRQAERMNKRLGTELADTRTHFSRAVKELDRERRAREILGQTCDELARGIGEERVEVEELKKESVKAREEVEKERQMLQLADVLREERVQMKLSEARYEFEEKNAALERLRSELEIYLKTGTSKGKVEGSSTRFDGISDFNDFLQKMQLGSFCDREREQGQSDGEVDDAEEDSGDSELHSIELNVDANNKAFQWNFTCDGTNQDDSRRASLDEVFKGRRSLSEKIQWENICLQKKTPDAIEWDFTNKQGNANGFVTEKSSDVFAYADSNDHNDDFKRYMPVKSLQRLPSCKGSASPAMSTGRSSSLREACSAILQDLAARRDQLDEQCVGIKK